MIVKQNIWHEDGIPYPKIRILIMNHIYIRLLDYIYFAFENGCENIRVMSLIVTAP